VNLARTWTEIDWDPHMFDVRVLGRTTRYVDFGEGPPLLLIHGMAGSWQSWLANIPELGRRHRVIAVDLPGFGGSEPLAPGSAFGAYAGRLEALLDELGIPSVAVFGHSLGGLVALELAAASPRRVRCAVLVSGGGADLTPVRLSAIQLTFWLFKLVMSVPGMSALVRRSPLGRLLLRPAVYDSRSVPRELLREMIPRTVGAGFMDGVRLGGQGLRALDVSTVSAPVLLAWGREDHILPLSAGHQLEARLREARLVVFDKVGHCAMFEAPRRFNKLAEGFLAAQRSDRGTPAAGRATARSWLAPTPVPNTNAAEGVVDGTVG